MPIDETYRRFHSGRFGPEAMPIEYNTQIGGAVAVPASDKKKPKKKDEENTEDASAPNDALTDDVGDQSVEYD